MRNIAIALVALATLTTGCASMGTRRPTGGGGSITKTVNEREQVGNDASTVFDGRADLGQR